jgi:hypothetical protein
MNNNSQHTRHSKIHNEQHPKSRNNQRTRNAPTEEIVEEEEAWQSTGQLPFIMVGSQQSRGDKHRAPTNIVITNSTFNYRSNH